MMQNNILRTTAIYMVYGGGGDLTFTRTLPRYPAIIDIKFPTRRCNGVINKVASLLYPLQDARGTPVGLSAIEVLTTRIPKSKPRALHLTETSCDMFGAVKKLTWDNEKSIGEYIATYTGVGVGGANDNVNNNVNDNVNDSTDYIPCIMHVKRDPHKWIALPSTHFNPDAAAIVMEEIKLRSYTNITLITARVDCVDDFITAVLTACSLIGKRGTIAVAFSGHIMNNMIGAMFALASISGKFELIKPEASDDVWVVGTAITPPTTAVKSKLHDVVVGELFIGVDVVVNSAGTNSHPFVEFVAEFSRRVSTARADTNKFIESVASKYESSASKFIPELVGDDITQEYRTTIAELSKIWMAKYSRV